MRRFSYFRKFFSYPLVWKIRCFHIQVLGEEQFQLYPGSWETFSKSQSSRACLLPDDNHGMVIGICNFWTYFSKSVSQRCWSEWKKLTVSSCRPVSREIGKTGEETCYLSRGETLSGPAVFPSPGTLNVVLIKKNFQTGMICMWGHHMLSQYFSDLSEHQNHPQTAC